MCLSKTAIGQSFKKLEERQLGVGMVEIAFLYPCSETLYHDKVSHLLSLLESLAAETGLSECSNPMLFQQAVHHRLLRTGNRLAMVVQTNSQETHL